MLVISVLSIILSSTLLLVWSFINSNWYVKSGLLLVTHLDVKFNQVCNIYDFCPYDPSMLMFLAHRFEGISPNWK
jgi:hypothetical protein